MTSDVDDSQKPNPPDAIPQQDAPVPQAVQTREEREAARKKAKEIRNATPKNGKPKKRSNDLMVKAMRRSTVLGKVRKRHFEVDRLLGVDALTRAWIDRDLLEVEPMLQESMWVAYRYMPPWERNEEFYRAYRAERKEHASAKHAEPASADKLAWCSIGEINAITRARIEADMAGVPYDLYCQTVIRGHMRSDKWDQLPLPNQMYGKLAIPRLRRKLTRAQISSRLYGKDWDPRFLAVNYAGDPIQEAALNLLREDVHASENKIGRLRTYLRSKNAMTRERAMEMFGADMVKDATGWSGAHLDEPDPRNYRPGCFGYHTDDVEAPCGECRLAEYCKSYVPAVTEEMKRLTGSDDPRRDHQRMVNAARSQRHYEKRAKQAGKEVKRRHRPRTDGPGVDVNPKRMPEDKPMRVPAVPTVYRTEAQEAERKKSTKWIDDIFDSL